MCKTFVAVACTVFAQSTFVTDTDTGTGTNTILVADANSSLK